MSKRLNRVAYLGLSIVMLMSLCACGQKDAEETVNDGNGKLTESVVENTENETTEVVENTEHEIKEVPQIAEDIETPVKEIKSDNKETQKSIDFMQNYLKENVKDSEYQIVDFDDRFVIIDEDNISNPTFSEVTYNVKIGDKNYQFIHNITDGAVITDYKKAELYKDVCNFLYNQFPKVEDKDKIEHVYCSLYTIEGLFFAEDKTVDDVLNHVSPHGIDDNYYNIYIEAIYHNIDRKQLTDDYSDTLNKLAEYDGAMGVTLQSLSKYTNVGGNLVDYYDTSVYYSIAENKVNCYDDSNNPIQMGDIEFSINPNGCHVAVEEIENLDEISLSDYPSDLVDGKSVMAAYKLKIDLDPNRDTTVKFGNNDVEYTALNSNFMVLISDTKNILVTKNGIVDESNALCLEDTNDIQEVILIELKDNEADLGS